jgi:formylglycine-generating enzyme required for sulfatase activity
VTIHQYNQFIEDGGYDNQSIWSEIGWRWVQSNPATKMSEARTSGRDLRHPVVAVSWFEADAYCRWRGGSLPSDDQWSGAVCSEQRFPWGDDEASRSPSSGRDRQVMSAGPAWFAEGKYGHVTTVNTLPSDQQRQDLIGPHGLLHGAGNVWEWTSTPFNTETDLQTLRGGSYTNLPSYCICDHREPARATDQRLTVGFRCSY